MASLVPTSKFMKYSGDAEYIVICDTCDKIFYRKKIHKLSQIVFDIPFKQLKNFSDEELNQRLSTRSWGKPTSWYIDACEHWVDSLIEKDDFYDKDKMHKINVYVIEKRGDSLFRDLVFRLSEYWFENLKNQVHQSKEAMYKEIQYLRDNLR